MAETHVLHNVRLYCGAADLTGQSNKLELGVEYEERDVTTFGSVDAAGKVWKAVRAGLAGAKVTAGGLWSAGDPSQVDDDMWSALGGIGAWTIYPHRGPAGVAPGALAYIVNALRAQYALLGSPGDVAPWAASATSTWPAVRGVGLHPPGTARTTAGVGTAQQRPVVPEGGFAYASLHVLSLTAGATFTATLQSAATSAFTSPTDRHTFTAATVRGGQIARVPGPITDPYWRITWDITGTTPSALFVSAIGVK